MKQKRPILALLFFWVIHFTADAQAPVIEFEKAWGGSLSEKLADLLQEATGSYVVTGEAFSDDGDVSEPTLAYDIWLLRISAGGVKVRDGVIGGVSDDKPVGLMQLPTGDLVIAANTYSPWSDYKGLGDIYLAFADSLFQTSYGSNICLGGSQLDEARHIAKAGASGYVICGGTKSTDGDVTGNHGMMDAWVLAYPAGEAFKKCIGGSNNDIAQHVIQLADGGYLIVGDTYSSDGDMPSNKGGVDVFVAKLNSAGTIVWIKTFGGSSGDYAKSALELADGKLIICGTTFSTDHDFSGNTHATNGAAWIMKLNSSGSKVWAYTYGSGLVGGYEEAYDIMQNADGTFTLIGSNSAAGVHVKGSGYWAGEESCFGVLPDLWLLNLSASGKKIKWEGSYGGGCVDGSAKIIGTADGYWMMAATTNSSNGQVTNAYPGEQIWVAKLGALSCIVPQNPMAYMYGFSGFSRFDWDLVPGAKSYVFKVKPVGGSYTTYEPTVASQTLLLSPGTYKWKVKAKCDPDKTSSAYTATLTHTVPAREGDVLDNVSALAAFPNPFQNSITLSFSVPNNRPKQVEVYDLSGKKLFSGGWQVETTFVLATERWAPGMYVIRINDTITQWTRTVIKD
ncbi:MAG: T9SS type A sorting domain-containing protein [Chitinophagales bacterium]|nr:T9SS type A sorting domain-containing protein [Chitinophagales bacterium]MDW8393932.1 T9SS type A sorting domain-containing protein [Chitinophagales bacterium]